MKILTKFDGNIDQALDKWPNHLYVVNAVKSRMTILIDIKDSNNKTINFSFPKTWFPIDILDYVDREAARKSSQLRNFIRAGVLKIVDADEAEKAVATSEAQEEAKRCGLLNFANADIESSTKVEEKVKVIDESGSSVEMDFYDLKKLAIEEAGSAKDALDAASEVYSTYTADADEDLIANEKITNKIRAMQGIAETKNYSEASAKLNELLKFIEENK